MADRAPRIAVALVHHPVVNKTGQTVTSSVTTIDVHDMARICKTYGACELYIVTPLEAQKRMVERITRHWTEGYGAKSNPHRKEALLLVKVVDSVDDILHNYQFGAGGARLVTTSAKESETAVSYQDARSIINNSDGAVILFGTASGMADSVMEKADVRLKPLEGVGDYNHLPVRCAAAIIMDRLFGR